MDANPRRPGLDHQRFYSGRENALLVKNAVVGQKHLVVITGDTAFEKNGGRVVHLAVHRQRTAENNHPVRRQPTGQLVQLPLAIRHKVFFQDQVFRGITRKNQLREHNNGSPLFRRLL